MKLVGVTIAFLLALGVLAACSATSRDYYVKGRDLMMVKDYTGALEAFNKGLESDPESPLLTYEKARALYNLERWQEAMDVLTRFLELTNEQKSSYADERWNADFWIKKCEEHLGIKREPEHKKSSETGDEDTIGGITMEYR